MKKLVALLLAFVMVLGVFAGCNTEKPVETKPAETQPAQTQPAETQPAETEPASVHPVTTEPITISILTTRHAEATNNADGIWFFKYLEWWLHEEYGYNVTIDVQQTMETKEQISLLLGTDSLPDIVWGIPLDNTQTVVFGQGEGMILDWTEWLNETYMPNAYAALYSDTYGYVRAGITAPDGGIYSMPELRSRSYNTAASCLGQSQDRLFIYTPWLEELGLEMPTNIDEFYAMLEAFKTMQTPDGSEVIPLIGYPKLLEKALWTMLGYYGGTLSNYGTAWAIKNEEVVFPAYSEDYKTFVTVMNTLYTNGYISPDHFTMDKTTMRGLTKAGVAGAASDYTFAELYDWENWESMPWFAINEGDELHISAGAAYEAGRTWASASTEYPEVVALIVDYMYTQEAINLYHNGPKQGEDPLGLVDGWYLDADGNVTTKLVEEGVYESFTFYCYQYIRPYDYYGGNKALTVTEEYMEWLGKPAATEYKVYDTVIGNEFSAYETTVYTHDDIEGHWFLSNAAASKPYITLVFLPAIFMGEEDALQAADLLSVLKNHIESETAKFVTGIRPLSELDAFMAELEALGVKEYVEMYKEAYAPYMEGIYG